MGGNRMRPKRPYVARPDQVTIARQGEYAVIEYLEPNVSGVQLKIGPAIAEITDADILDAHNAVILAQQKLAAEYVHVAKEVPEGRPQIEYFAPGGAWTPRGDVLRCVVDSALDGDEPVIHIDDHELSWAEFGRMLLTWEGWGIRIVMVPDDELTKTPLIEIGERRDD
jgi:hypothetical protein